MYKCIGGYFFMENLEIYQDISGRTGGDVYIGVVGPVRTGKSSFIKNFMELLVLPNIDNVYKRERAIDELPQSASGKTIMTTEPKFIPNEAVEINLNGNIKLKTRLVDCVGYLVNNALGHMENDMPRMVKTPWSVEEIPFETAAELGTKKVIVEHSTVGMVVTTDGSITDIPREDYVEAEERVIRELKELNKPFIIILNSNDPYSEYTKNLANQLEKKYSAQVVTLNCLNMNIEDVNEIFEKLLYEFEIDKINLRLPKWINGLDYQNEVKQGLFEKIKSTFGGINKIKEVQNVYQNMLENENIKSINISEINLGTGVVNINVELQDYLFYNLLSEITGEKIDNEGDLFSCIFNLSKIKKDYDKMSYALHEVTERGYGIVI